MPAKKDMPWFRRLADGHLEIFLKAGDYKVRAHGPEAEMYELVEWFEDKAGVTIHGNWKRPPRRGPRQLEGQTSLLEMDEVTEAQPEEDEELTPLTPPPLGYPSPEPYGPTVRQVARDMGTLG